MSADSKKDIIRNYNIQINDSSTMETLQEINQKYDIEDSTYDQFIEKLTIAKFKEFSSYCKDKEIENIRHDMKLKKYQFIQIMKSVFPGRTDFYPIFEQIFNRFKLLKCKIIYSPKNDNYFIDNIYSNEEIDIFEISCALACFIKCFFFEKLKILFDLVDIDEDGFINVTEIKKLIYTLNYLFCREENSLGVESNVVLLSLASIKAKKSYELIMRHPGNLSYILHEEKYINFNHFNTAIKRVYNYKYSLIPLFISLKYSLNINRTEKELEIRKNNFNDFSKISSEVFSSSKKDGDTVRTNLDFKKNLEPIKKENSNKSIKTGSQILNNIGNIYNVKSSKSIKLISSPKNFNYENRYTINYNKICGLEVYPGKLKIKEKENIISSFSPERQSQSRIPYNLKSINVYDNKKGNIPGYMTLVEILDEIGSLINKHKNIDAGQELTRIWKETKNENEKVENQLREPLPLTSIESLKPYIFDEIFQKKLH